MTIQKTINSLQKKLTGLSFSAPVSHVYNPMAYAKKPFAQYLKRYGRTPKEIILVGMNPGPWGMAQTGVPFGDVTMVTKWLKIDAGIEIPVHTHPKKPVMGYDCHRGEVSGRRLWGWAKKIFHTPEAFFSRFFVINYCPLMFLEAGGGNRTPDKIRLSERVPLLDACDEALRDFVEFYNPSMVIGVGVFAARQCEKVLKSMDVKIGRITHPSPANPKANKGWESVVKKEFTDMGIRF